MRVPLLNQSYVIPGIFSYFKDGDEWISPVPKHAENGMTKFFPYDRGFPILASWSKIPVWSVLVFMLPSLVTLSNGVPIYLVMGTQLELKLFSCYI